MVRGVSSGARRVIGVAVAFALLAFLLVSVLVGSAVAVAPGPAFRVQLVARPTVFSAQYNGTSVPDMYEVVVTNSGSRPTDGSPITVSDELPPGETLDVIRGLQVGTGNNPSRMLCEAAFLTCTTGAALQPSERLIVQVAVNVASGAVGPLTDAVRVSGGGAPSVSANVATAVGSLAESTGLSYGVAAFGAETTGVNGLADVQAGDHPYETTVSFNMNSYEVGTLFHTSYESAGGLNGQPAHTKDIIVDVPPGFVGDPNVVEKCPQYKVVRKTCPPSTQIGDAFIAITEQAGALNSGFGGGNEYPIYNVVPDKGYPAEFVIDFSGIAVPLYVSVTPDSKYGVRVTTPGIPRIGSPIEVTTTFFGTPLTDASVYNEYRKSVSGVPPVSFLDNPLDCSTVTQQARIYVDSWERPGSYLADGQPNLADPSWKTATTTMFPSLSGCELLQFDPSLYVTPDTTQADEPAGVTVDLSLPQAPQEFPQLITPEVKATVVTLPSGMSLSPSAGDGLAGCTNAQIDFSSAAVGSCPDGSQVGTALVTTPLLNEPFHGQVYLGTPGCDPCSNADASDGNMFRLFLQLEGSGVVVKLEGHIYVNTTTGQLTTRFSNIPQLPVSNVQLHFNSGLRAGLATPQGCGVFTSTADLTPYSAPITPDATPESQFNVDWNGNGEACPGVWPFHPQFEAGTSNPNAGQLSPLTVTFNREDREQDFSQIKVTTPPGLLGSLTGIPLCGEPQADLGTCSAASQIGEMTVAAGPGSHPYYQKGMVYLTGPYRGAPFGLSIVTPTHAGPFNLGNIVVRATINVDPHTTALTVTTDPLPQIIDGIPLRLRKTNVTINRPGFIFNPTDCGQLHITATISGSQGTQSEESTPFAVSGCAGLPFGPKFSVYTSGKPSRPNGTSLDVRVVFPPGPQSNIAHVRVELPKQLPSRLPTLQKACPAAVFEANPAACPAASVIGAVRTVTPVIPVPLRGPVYFVSHGGEAFPNLVAVLQGYGVRVDLIGDTFISKQGVTSSTFTNIPDVPVSSFEMYLPQGPYSALTVNGNPCRERLVMPTLFTAQDGAQLKQNTPIQVTGCPKAKAAKAKKAARAARARKAARARHERRTK
jgi:hypothetical protein